MALVLAVVAVALLSSNRTVRKMIPSESIIAFGTTFVVLLALFRLDRLG